MSQIIDMLNSMESFRNKLSSKKGSLQEESIDGLAQDNQPPVSTKAKRTVLGRAAGWSLVALLLTGAGVAAHGIWPNAYATSSLFKESSAASSVTQYGSVSITSTPPKVGVLMDGQFVGVTPLKFDWLVGSHRLVLKLNGYHDVVTIVKVTEGHAQDLDLFLFPIGVDKQMDEVVKPLKKVEANIIQNKPAQKIVAKPKVVMQQVQKPEPIIPKMIVPEIVVPEIIEKMAVEPKKIIKPVFEKPVIKKSYIKKPAIKKAIVKKKIVRRGAPPEALSYIKSGNKLSGSADGATELQYKYTIQVGAFLSRDSALAYAQSWKKKGYDAYILELWGVKDPSKLWQSVRIGHFNDLTRATDARKAFSEWEKKYCYVALWDSFAPPDNADTKDVASKVVVGKVVNKKAVAKKAVAKKITAIKAVVKPQNYMAKAIKKSVAKKTDMFDADESAAYAVVNSPNISKASQKVKIKTDTIKDKSELDMADDITLPKPSIKQPKKAQDLEKPPAMVVHHTSSDVEGMFFRSAQLRDQGKLDEAIELLNNLLSVDPDHGRARRRLARIYVESGQANEALVLLQGGVGGRSSLQLSKEEPNLAAFLAALYQRDEDHWHAIDLYENLLRRFPDKGVWQMGLAISLERVGEPADALKAYKTALNSGELNRKLRAFVKKRVQELK
jgi:tetratricopeptide (TPR) repeat protein